MSIRGKVAVLAAAAFVALSMPAHAAAPSDTVVATVNGTKIYKKDVMEAVGALGLGKAESKEIFPMVIDQIINEKLLDDAARASKIDKSEEYKQRIELMKTQLVKQMYFEKILASKVTDDKVKSAYNDFRKENKGKIEVHARHILVPTEVEAKQVIKDLDGGAKFEELAARRSSGPTAQKGGDLGYFLKEDMIPAFSEVAFRLKPGTYSKEPVQTEFGWHVIRVEDKRERNVPELKQVEMAIRNRLAQLELQKLLGTLREKAKIEVYGADGKQANGNGAQEEKKEEKKAAAPSTGDAARKLEAQEAAQKKE